MRRLISSLRSIRLRPATWWSLLVAGAPALASPLYGMDLLSGGGMLLGLWLLVWWFAALGMELAGGKGIGAPLVATASILIIFAVANSDLPITVDEWRTRATRERVVAEVLADPDGFPAGRWGVKHPDWPHGSIEFTPTEVATQVFLPRADFGNEGYLYAPAGDVQQCVVGHLALKQRLSAQWFWIRCSRS
ncbi:MAG TPA: hypothetical protein VGE07_13175 [Herpetosiphonaceae bacterium]